jgi:hypothetical protein
MHLPAGFLIRIVDAAILQWPPSTWLLTAKHAFMLHTCCISSAAYDPACRQGRSVLQQLFVASFLEGWNDTDDASLEVYLPSLPESYSNSSSSWSNSLALCTIMRNENITDLREWLTYYQCVLGLHVHAVARPTLTLTD